ncbi:MAG: hypothetical protein FJ404_01630 [Verrucomicrobia bacterium]|nr:hypothetical protein [Verrucomicrobiota bacterium]
MMLPAMRRILAVFLFLTGLPGGMGLLWPHASDFSTGWRIYRLADRMADTFSSSITVSSKTNVWIRHGSDFDRITRMDGYGVRTYAAPGEGTFPVHESRSGQLWSIYSEGVMLYLGDRWEAHPIPEIRQLIASEPLRMIKPIPIVPAEVDHVFILLPDRLMSYEADTRQATAVLLAADSGLERFNEMTESMAGGLWITGQRGIGRLEGPLRQVRTGLRWQPWPGPAGYQAFQRPVESFTGGVVTVAERTGGERVVTSFRAERWEVIEAPSTRVRFAWQIEPGHFWACSRDGLWEWNGQVWRMVQQSDLDVSGFNDVALEPSGVFWLATTDGVVRRGPKFWTRSRGTQHPESTVHVFLADPAGAAWFVGPDEILRHEGGRWDRYKSPAASESALENVRLAAFHAGDAIWIGRSEQIWRFDLASSRFERRPRELGGRKLLGQLRDGRVVLEGKQGKSLAMWIEGKEGAEMWFQIDSEVGLGEEVSAFLQSETSDVWIAGNGLVLRWRQGEIQSFGRSHGLIPVRAQCLIEYSPGHIWCGGGDLVQEFDGKGWRVIRSGFERVHQMRRMRDGGVLVASTSGLHRYFDGSWSSDGLDEGLPSLAVYDAGEDSRGRRWAATVRGPVLADESADVDPPRSTVVPARENRGLAGAESHRFLIRGFDRWKETPSERLLFSRSLDGGAWTPFQYESSVTLAGLAAGTHRLEVRAMDRAWNRERTPTVMEFTVVLPWHRDPRLVGLSIAGCLVVMFFAGLAVNRHRRLVRSYAEVEQIVAQRTQELERANEELLHSQKMRALGTLAAGVAHDFNNILSVIKGSTQVIEQNLEDRDKVLARAERIRTVVDQGSTLVKAMLGMGRGASEAPVECDVRELVEGAAKSLGEAVASAATLDVQIDSGTPRVVTVRNLVQQVLHNLFANGVDAMGGGGVLRIRARALTQFDSHILLPPDGPGPWVELSVTDSGTGMDPDVLPRIFEPFFTTKAFSKRRGTGLGLSMVYEMAKGLGIGLHVRTSKGQGSTFSLVIPLQRGGGIRGAPAALAPGGRMEPPFLSR